MSDAAVGLHNLDLHFEAERFAQPVDHARRVAVMDARRDPRPTGRGWFHERLPFVPPSFMFPVA
jgi:hypothetical protein